MFSGLIVAQGRLVKINKFVARDHPMEDVSMGIASEMFAGSKFDVGSSIACSGVCLTLTREENGVAYFDVSKETLRCTTLGTWVVGEGINLERSLKMGDEVGGHIVTGHVDGIAKVESIIPTGGSYQYRFSLHRDVGQYIAIKGSVALDGISLTVNDVSDKEHTTFFEVNVIPHTFAVTNLSKKRVGSSCNIEIDVLMRYIRRLTDGGLVDGSSTDETKRKQN